MSAFSLQTREELPQENCPFFIGGQEHRTCQKGLDSQCIIQYPISHCAKHWIPQKKM